MRKGTGFKNLKQFLDVLRQENEIVDVYHEVDPHLEIAEIHRRVIAAEGPALFFHQVKGSPFPMVTNLFGTLRRIELAFSNRPDLFVEDLIGLVTKEFPPSLWKHRHLLKNFLHLGTKKQRRAPVSEIIDHNPNLEELPLLKTWPLDGGPFVTLPLVYTEPPGGGAPNIGMYRIQRYDRKTTGLHFQIAKGGGFHYHLAETKGESLPVNIFIGGPPALMLSAISPLPENVSELLFCSFLLKSKVSLARSPINHYPLISECEFALLGYAEPQERRAEGPFGDHYGYYSWIHDFPVFRCKALLRRKNAIYPATVVGKPRQEDFYIGNYLQKLLSPIFPLVMPGVKALWSYGETGFHSLSAAVVKERYYRECMSSAFRILGEGQLALTKCLLLTDQPIDIQDFKLTLTTILERFKPETDLFIFSNLSLDTLDYTGPELNKGSRAVFLGIGNKVRTLPERYVGPLPRPLTDCSVFCPGCLIIQGPAFKEFQDFDALLAHPSFAEWPLLILVDNLKKATRSVASLLWTTFTRFEPAADIHARDAGVFRHHLSYKPPLLIDARMKPTYPPEVSCDPETAKKVSQKWSGYFSEKVEMGESEDVY